MKHVSIAKALMKLNENTPTLPDNPACEMQEIFRHKIFTEANEQKRKEIMFNSSMAKYQSELNYPWDNYFSTDIHPFLHNKNVLDLGCFNGGRSIAWFERYQIKKIFGIDVKQTFIDASTQFASSKGIDGEYKVAKGEKLPFESESFDAILSFDVFEHVQNIEKTLDECWRTLKPKGHLLLVFPSFFHPTEHHMNAVTKTPFFHYFFSCETLITALNEIIEERGESAHWYKRNPPAPQSWERGNTINGTTLRKFKKAIDASKWEIKSHSRKAIGSIGRNIAKKKWPVILSNMLYPFTAIPFLREATLHRITYILKKKPLSLPSS